MLSETVVEWTRSWKEEGLLEGKIEGKIEVARRMKEEGMDPALILRLTDIRVEDLDAKPVDPQEGSVAAPGGVLVEDPGLDE